MTRRKPAEIIRGILRILREKPLSLRALETKMNTNDRTIREYTKLLEELSMLKLKQIRRGKRITTQAELEPKTKKLNI